MESKINIPQHEIDAIARTLLPAIREFYADPKNQKEYGEWLLTEEGQKAHAKATKIEKKKKKKQ